MSKIEDLQARLLAIHEEEQVIIARADDAKRELSREDKDRLEALNVEFAETEKDLELRQREIARATRLAESVGRRTDPSVGSAPGSRSSEQALVIQGPGIARNVRDVSAETRGGFRHLGDYCQSIVRASLKGGEVDRRLTILNAAAATAGGESIGADGGFAVPPDFRTQIMELADGEPNLRGLCNNLSTNSLSVTMPVDETTPWGTAAGIRALWTEENTAGAPTKPALRQVTIRCNKLMALVPASDELLRDAALMNSYLPRRMARAINFSVDEAILRGSGNGQPLGVLRAPSLVTVAKVAAQAADTVVPQNIYQMYTRMPAVNRANARWILHQDVETQLLPLEQRTPNAAGTDFVGGWPLYIAPGGLTNAPEPRILGRPVIYSQACETLGDLGDAFYVDLSEYLLVTNGGGIRTDVSMHLYFDADQVAFKATMRIGGMPWLAAAIADRDGTTTRSPFIVLGERA